jgi:hypothetical protein
MSLLSALSTINPFLSAATTGVSLFKSLKGGNSSKLNTVSYFDALNQAKEAINSNYTQGLQRSLSSLNASAASRGVSGQARTQAQKASLISQSEADRSSAAAGLAQNIMNGQNAQNTSAYQAQNAQNQQTYQNQQSGLQALINLLNNNGDQVPATEKGTYQTVQNGSSSSGSGTKKYNYNDIGSHFTYTPLSY